jgi:hypothetical protein
VKDRSRQAGATETEASGIESASNVVLFPCSALEDENRTADVERVNHYPLYELGKALNGLRFKGTSIQARETFFDIPTAHREMQRLLSGIPFPLGISRKAAEELQGEIQRISEDHFTRIDQKGKRVRAMPDDDETIESWEMFVVQQKLEKI